MNIPTYLPACNFAVLTAATIAGERAAAELTVPKGSSMAITDRKPKDYEADVHARLAFAKAAIECYRAWVSTPKPPEGWFMVGLEDEIREHDMVWTSQGEWQPVPSYLIGTKRSANNLLCRKLPEIVPNPAGDGYRILLNNESVRQSDEAYWGGKWVSIMQAPGWYLADPNLRVLRRKIDLDQPPQSASIPTG